VSVPSRGSAHGDIIRPERRPAPSSSDHRNQIGLETDKGSEGIKAAFGVNYDRLVALKNKYDPSNLVRHDQNIKSRV
jgi:hypothetical protein